MTGYTLQSKSLYAKYLTIDSYKKGKGVINRYNLDRRGSDISSIINKLLVETDESHFDG